MSKRYRHGDRPPAGDEWFAVATVIIITFLLVLLIF